MPNKFTVEITGPNGWTIDESDMQEILGEGIANYFGWRASSRGASFTVTEISEVQA